ncbi:hypothetical protein GUJ93_ZPchr0010g7303 [Zizania palustris]|uniref:Uncharacterized protein n=1 Tax=Zizania palustris TaxID=103762 RepID=A0A8J6BP43_ZIZPA|nr:hypothetical protein GUJ93_ZPchr0010g7303 [Zizania palustris]
MQEMNLEGPEYLPKGISRSSLRGPEEDFEGDPEEGSEEDSEAAPEEDSERVQIGLQKGSGEGMEDSRRLGYGLGPEGS